MHGDSNPMRRKTPEERRAIAAKALETKRRKRQIKETKERRLDALLVAIEEAERKLAALKKADILTHRAIELTNGALLTEGEIVKSSALWLGVPGVYFLISDGAVVYVGQSVNVYARIATHKREGVKEFDRFAFVPCKASKLDKLESLYIHCLRPPLNGDKNNGELAAPLRIDQLL